ncbi:hypothetical protein H5410_043239 [Solanum commersonii]|uniref:Uncharacterized protein n=1 Tax=Solanum commersonii TaxID=4109 RepID=A0A9J5XXW5_SOLCO|nr:hypothetical protein H5410_043239 [Solanum commersonii]
MDSGIEPRKWLTRKIEMHQTTEITNTISKWKVIQLIEGNVDSLEMTKFCEAIVSIDGSA